MSLFALREAWPATVGRRVGGGVRLVAKDCRVPAVNELALLL